jgi:hypothetical protein
VTRADLQALRDVIDTIVALPDHLLATVSTLFPPPRSNGADPDPKPNGAFHKPHHATVSARPAMTGRKLTGMITDKMALAKAEEDKLILAIIANPGAGPKQLATMTGAKLNSTSERLTRLQRRGAIEKDGLGKWRALDTGDPSPRPTKAPTMGPSHPT